MKLNFAQSVLPAGDGITKVTTLAWSPSGRRLAAVTTDRIILLFDEAGQRRDRIPTKPADTQGARNYQVRGVAFSPDSTKIAVAQSDKIVFVYKVGSEWGDKKSICNKFHQQTEVTCIAWPSQRPTAPVFGLADGRVRCGHLKTNKSGSLYNSESYVVVLTCTQAGDGFLSGHIDGSIFMYRYSGKDDAAIHTKVTTHSCPPYALGHGESIVAGGYDCKVVFYSESGNRQSSFDCSKEKGAKEFTVCGMNPTGTCAIMGSFNALRVYNYHMGKRRWEEADVQHVEHMYTVTALQWRADGGGIAVGSLCGAISLFESHFKRVRYRDEFDLTYVTPSQVIVKSISDGTRIAIRSQIGAEITKLNIYEQRYIVAHTEATMLFGDLHSRKMSEIGWQRATSDQLRLDLPNLAVIFNAGEATIVEYGHNDPLGVLQCEDVGAGVFAARATHQGTVQVAYLLDVSTIRVQDLASNTARLVVEHGSPVVWLDLSHSGAELAFCDLEGRLHLFGVATDIHRTLLDYCTFSEFVPESNVLVAQSRDSLCVWYQFGKEGNDAMIRTKLRPEATVTEIREDEAGTSVYIDDGLAVSAHTLDPTLLGFDAALNDQDLPLAMQLLDAFGAGPLSETVDTTSMWQNVGDRALALKELPTAERCFVAIDDVSRARYVRKLIKLASVIEPSETPETEPAAALNIDNYEVRARLAVLNNMYTEAESIYLEHGQLEKALDMYQEVQQWDNAIRLAEKKNHPDAGQLRQDYIAWLLETNQHEKAGALLEEKGDIDGAISAYLKGNVPAKAATVVVQYESKRAFQPTTLEAISSALVMVGLKEKAGYFYERMHMHEKAMSVYLEGKHYSSAVRLARVAFPGQVQDLERQWAEYLVSVGQHSNAVNHFVEAHMLESAIIAAARAKHWRKVLNLIPSLPSRVEDIRMTDELRAAVDAVASYFTSQEAYGDAERVLIAFGMAKQAADINIAAGRADRASAIIQEHLPEEAGTFLKEQAKSLAQGGRYNQAEEAYLASGQFHEIFDMYYAANRYDDIIRAAQKPGSGVDVVEVNKRVGERLLGDNQSTALCEKYLLAGEQIVTVIKMYLQSQDYNNAVRVAKTHGNKADQSQVAIAYVRSMGGATPEAIAFLQEHDIVQRAVHHAVNVEKDYPLALTIARAVPALKRAVPEIEYKQALALEDVGDFDSASALFISSGRAQEAIDMYTHVKQFVDALRVAKHHVPAAIDDIRLAHAADLIEEGKADDAVVIYQTGNLGVPGVIALKQAGFWKQALDLAETHAPGEVTRVQREMAASEQKNNHEIVSTLLDKARADLKRREFIKALEGFAAAGRAGGGAPAWDQAVSIAQEFVKGHLARVATEAAEHMSSSGQPVRAAELYSIARDHDTAISTLLRAGLLDEARTLAQDQAPHLLPRVDDAQREALVAEGDTSQLLKQGDVDTALQLFEQDGRWEDGLDALSKAKNKVATLTFAMRYVSHLSDAERVREAAVVMASRKENIFPLQSGQDSELEAIANVAGDILLGVGIDTLQESQEAIAAILQVLRVVDPSFSVGSTALKEDIRRYTQVCHLFNIRHRCLTDPKAPDAVRRLGYKVSVALVRYCDIVAVDRVFFDGGIHASEINLPTLSFIFTSRFLDLLEAMEDADGTTVIENNDFTDTDIPYDFALPFKSLVSDEQKEEASERVLTMSMDPDSAHQVPLVTCESCQQERYLAGLKCVQCSDEREACIITGWPVWTQNNNRVACESCAQPANREDWNRYVEHYKKCPWCQAEAVPRF